MKDTDKPNKRLIEELKILLESENLYRMIFESANDGIIIHDVEGHIFDVNQTMYKRLGYTKQDFLKMSLKDLVAPEFSQKVKERVGLLKKEGVAIFESADRRKDGTVMPVEVSARYVDYKGQKVILSIVRDINERKLAEDLIMSTLREKDILLKEIKRQTRFELEIFSRTLERLSRTSEGDAVFEETKNAQNRIKSLTYIKERLYRFPSISKIDFAELTTRLVRFVSSLYPIEEKNIRIKNEIQYVYFDLVKAIPLALIINEFLSNSLKHAFHDKSKGEIAINVSKKKNGKHVLRFFDNGNGFPDTLDFRNTTTLGMGLVKELVDYLNGNIELNTNEGTEFIVEF